MDYTDWARLAAWNIKTAQIWYYLSLGMAIVGIVGNVLCVKVMGKVQKNVKGVRLIKYLAVVDTIVLLLYIVFIIPMKMFFLDRGNVYYVECTKFLFIPAHETIKMIQIHLTVLIAVQRCLALTMPFRFKRIMRNSVLRKLLAGILVFALLFNIPMWLICKPLFYWNDDFQMALIRCDYYAIISKKMLYYWYIIQCICITVAPIVLLVVCNITLIIARQRMTRIGPSRDRMSANQLTMIVIAITAMSLVEHCFYVAVYVANDLQVDINLTLNYTDTTTLITLMYAGDFIICFNSSTNFIFYCTFGREFRRTLMAMFKRRTPTHQPQQNVIALREIPPHGSEV